MGDSTSFAALIGKATSEKIVLVEINVAEHLLGWSLTGGQTNTYEISFLNETIDLPNGTTETIRKAISAVEEDSTALTVRTSIATVEANAGSYWHDTASAKLYVHMTDSDSTTGHTIIGFFWLYFATKGIELNGRYYEPYIGSEGIPNLIQSNPNLYWGVVFMAQGLIHFLNERGYFDQISERFIWTNKTVRLLIGGDSLPYSEYKILYNFKVLGKNFTRNEFSLEVGSEPYNLMTTIPTNKFLNTNYPNLDPKAEGLPIPIYYGVYNANQAPIATCIHSSFAANCYQFKLCDHAINSFTQAYINYEAGSGWETINSSNVETTAATFTILSTHFRLGASRVKAAFQGKASSGTVIEGAPDVIEDILRGLLNYASSNLQTTSFTDSKAESEFSLNVPIEKEIEAISIIEGICRTDLGFFDIDENGKFRYRTWKPYITSTMVGLKDEDFLDVPEVIEQDINTYPRISVGYNYNCAEKIYSYHDETNAEAEAKYGKKNQFKIDSYLKTKSNATVTAQRLNLLTKDPTPKLNMSLKMPVIDHFMGDKVKITMTRAPSDSGEYDERVFEINEKQISCFPFINRLQAFDLQTFGENVGFWTATGAPAWSAAASSDKEISGFWSSDNGYVATTDPSSLNASQWW